MDQIGFTFYPRDWWTSDKFFELETGIERYIYLELLFAMYMDPRGARDDRAFMSKKLRIDIPQTVWNTVTKSFTRVGDYLQSETVKKRRTKAEAARINGAKGGRPEGSNQKPKNPEMETHGKPNENPNNPHYKEKEKRKGNIQHSVGSVVSMDKVVTQNRPLPPLRAAGSHGDDRLTVWKKYGDELEKFLEDEKPRDRMEKAIEFFWPFAIPGDELAELKQEIAKLDDTGLLVVLGELQENLQNGDGTKFDEVLKFVRND